MYVPGESVRGIPIEYPLTHEYGHHIALLALEQPVGRARLGRASTGRARCASARGVRRGLLFPGNQGAHYWDDPGEGFADGYAHMHYPHAPWYYNELMRPDAEALAAIRRDVLQPWTAPRSRTFHGRLGSATHVRTFHIRLTLDGDVDLQLTAPRGIGLRGPGRDARTSPPASGCAGGGEFGVEWCRQRAVDHVKLTVRRRAGSGPFALRVSWPG